MIVRDSKDADNSVILQIIVIVYMLGLAAVLYLSMKGHETILMYFGFLRGKFSKAFFLLFCACIVLNSPDSGKIGWSRWTIGAILALAAIL